MTDVDATGPAGSAGPAEPALRAFAGAVVVGIETRTSNREESDPSAARIPALWARFHRDDIASRVGGAGGALPVGVYTQYESDESGAYTLLAGVLVDKGATVPEGLRMAFLPEGQYLVFTVQGELPRALIDGWRRVWRYFERRQEGAGAGARRAFRVDFEIHRAPDRAEIHIGLRP